MEHTIRIHALGAAIVIALGVAASLVTSTVVASRAYKGRGDQAAKSQQELTVKGSARIPVRSDLGVWSLAVSGEGPTLQESYGVLEFGVERVQAFLRDQGFNDETIWLGPIDTRTHHALDKDGRETRRIDGYTLNRVFTITSSDVQNMSAAAGEVTKLLQENVRVRSYAPAYTYTSVADLKVRALGEASNDARVRAEEIAAKSGCRVGEVRRASMGVMQITRPHSTEVSGSGIYDTSTIEKDVSVVVTVTFGIQSR